MIIFFGWIIWAFIVAIIGSHRKIGFIVSFIVSIFLSPLIGLIFVLVSPSIASEKHRKEMSRKQDELLEATRALAYSQTPQATKKERTNYAARLHYFLEQKEKGLISAEEYEDKKKILLRMEAEGER